MADIDATLMFPTRTENWDAINDTMKGISDTCSDKQKIEILIKIDSDINHYKYIKILESYKFQYKILSYPRYGAYNDVHLFDFDLAKISRGKCLWLIGDDVSIQGDWLGAIQKSRNKFNDNIYTMYFQELRGRGRRLGAKCIGNAFPILSREFYKCLGYICTNRCADRFIRLVSGLLDRSICDASVRFQQNCHSGRLYESHSSMSVFMEEEYIKRILIPKHFTPLMDK